MIVLDAKAVAALLPYEALVPAMHAALRAFSAGEVTQPVRTVVRPPSRDGDSPGLFGAMSAHAPFEGRRYFGIKSVVVKADNPARGLHTHVGTVTVFDPETGLPLVVADASTITELRTAAVSAVATDALARSGPTELAIIGAGTQARAHVEAIRVVRPVTHLRVWNRTESKAEELAAWARTTFGLEARVCPSVREATRGAGVVCTVTASKEPLLGVADVDAGAHVNAVGACQPGARELDSALVAASAVYLDSRDAARTEATELLTAIAEGRITESHPRGELGELLAGRCASRRDASEVTVFLSLGVAVEDVVAATLAMRRATATADDIGITVAFP